MLTLLTETLLHGFSTLVAYLSIYVLGAAPLGAQP